ncbi:FAD-dependent oxidoreductase [Specibacter sp. NPDC078709]|uniref:FAD-dependent oxidoreductase n=1 Tax=Specibacter sp. NPDC078709 TaxID=3154364 RepID=UPI00342C01B8
MAVTHKQTGCCIVGGGPAGMMLGLLLARAGVETTVLEKHADFFRDFRGDTIHPSTLDLIDQLDLRSAFLNIPQQSITTLDVVVGGTRLTPVNFGTLRGANRRIALMPQWDFLNLLAAQAQSLNNFHLLMGTEATGLLHGERSKNSTPSGGSFTIGSPVTSSPSPVTGVSAVGPDGEVEITAALTIAADGRDSALRKDVGLHAKELGAPIDVLWFQLPTPPLPPPDTLGYLRGGTMLITIPRPGYYQMGMLIPKDSFSALREASLASFRERITSIAPFLSTAVAQLVDWDQVKLLSVQLDRLDQWSVPGLLCIGDAAHAMSPVFGVGVNYAIQDAVAAARILAPPLLAGASTDAATLQVQRRRQRPVRLMQPLQQRVHKLLATGRQDTPLRPWQARLATLAAKAVQPITARVVGRGFLPEKLHDGRLLAAPRRKFIM